MHKIEWLTLTRTPQVHPLRFRRDGLRESIMNVLFLLMQCGINDCAVVNSAVVRCHSAVVNSELVRCLRVSESFIP